MILEYMLDGILFERLMFQSVGVLIQCIDVLAWCSNNDTAMKLVASCTVLIAFAKPTLALRPTLLHLLDVLDLYSESSPTNSLSLEG